MLLERYFLIKVPALIIARLIDSNIELTSSKKKDPEQCAESARYANQSDLLRLVRLDFLIEYNYSTSDGSRDY